MAGSTRRGTPRGKASATSRASQRGAQRGGSRQAGRAASSGRRSSVSGTKLSLVGGGAADPSRLRASSAQGTRPAFLENARQTPSAGFSRVQTAPSGKQRREKHQRIQTVRVALGVMAAILVLGLVLLIAYFVLQNSPVFEITTVECEPTEHVSEADIENLLVVPEGSTLLNFDSEAITASLAKDPWVGTLSFERSFPNTLKIQINEQKPEILVVMSSGSVAWYLGSDGKWIQPTRITTTDSQSVNDAALAKATSEGLLLVTNVPSSVDPSSGSYATDEVLSAVDSFRESFSSEFSAKVVSYSAPSTDNISCTLASGVEISLGSATQISAKESIATEILAAHEGKVTYINVRVASTTGSSYRSIDSDTVEAGTGVSGTAAESTSASSTASATDEGATSTDESAGETSGQAIAGSDESGSDETSEDDADSQASGSDEGETDGDGE